MEKQHRCKLCYRKFANGRALGGHMRSHMMKFYAEDNASKLENGDDFAHEFQSLRSYSLPSSSSEEDEEEEYDEVEREAVLRVVSSYELRENPKKSALLLDHNFPSVVVQGGDGDSEAESSEKVPICRRRSKRARETRISDFGVFKVRKRTKFVVAAAADDDQSSPLSSISDTTPEEHVAHCLIMLSKDKWEKEEREYVEDEDEEESEKFGNEDIFGDSGAAKMAKNKFRGKYRCEECNKLFRSYQALGGHRASHKKIKVNTPAAPPPPPPPPPKAEAKLHQCPFCERIFSSGQALGGHKRTHFIGAGAIPTNYNNSIDKASRISQAFSIDLNLPAPAEEEEIAISAVSDAEFVHPIKE